MTATDVSDGRVASLRALLNGLLDKTEVIGMPELEYTGGQWLRLLESIPHLSGMEVEYLNVVEPAMLRRVAIADLALLDEHERTVRHVECWHADDLDDEHGSCEKPYHTVPICNECVTETWGHAWTPSWPCLAIRARCDAWLGPS